MVKYQESATLSGPRQQQTVIEEMQVDRTRVELPSQPWGQTELQGCHLSTLHQPARLRNEREYFTLELNLLAQVDELLCPSHPLDIVIAVSDQLLQRMMCLCGLCFLWRSRLCSLQNVLEQQFETRDALEGQDQKGLQGEALADGVALQLLQDLSETAVAVQQDLEGALLVGLVGDIRQVDPAKVGSVVQDYVTHLEGEDVALEVLLQVGKERGADFTHVL